MPNENSPLDVSPLARSLLLCEYLYAMGGDRVGLVGVMNRLRPKVYPYTQPRLYTFAQLTDGIGDVSAFVQVRPWEETEPIVTSQTKTLVFPTPLHAIQVGFVITGCTFREPGGYVVELICDEKVVADAPLILLPAETSHE